MQNEPVFSVDIGGTSVKYALVRPDGGLAGEGAFATTPASPDVFFAALWQACGAAVRQGVRCIAFSSLGFLSPDGLYLGGVENIPFLDGLNLCGQAAARWPGTRSHALNDGSAAALGELWFGEGRGCRNFLCLTLGTGIGCALVLDGKPLAGGHHQAGEVGYYGYRGPGDYFEERYSTISVLRIAAETLGLPGLDGHGFFRLVRENQPVATRLLDEWMDALGRLLADYILLADPEKVLIGGGVSREADILIPMLRKKTNAHLPPPFRDKAGICPAKLGNKANLLGAATAFWAAPAQA